MNALAELLSSRVKAELCRLLFGAQAEELHMRELTRRSGCTFSAVQRELEKLLALGLVIRRQDGNRVYFKANARHPFYPEMRGLVRKSSGLRELLAEALRDRRIKAAFVFGSEASGLARPESDVDVMVIGNINLQEAVAKTSPLQEKLGREINPHVLSAEEFAQRVRKEDHFLTTVMREPKLFLIGDEDELEGLAN
ncbi:MAG: hypothetical protein AMXMBFR7_30820 [Planctomycetota bacterium]